jgi:hypothetical protein
LRIISKYSTISIQTLITFGGPIKIELKKTYGGRIPRVGDGYSGGVGLGECRRRKGGRRDPIEQDPSLWILTL